ncbi:MAG: hypothetical protein Q7J36_17010 [Thiobacillus sp.]|nr:hypothetical protein [Thiobacillus sp.]
MDSKLCAACGQLFMPRPQTPTQIYCPAHDCQRERRRRWQQSKRHHDPDYHDNQARAQQAWSRRNPDYWRQYRDVHPAYVARNREMQRERNSRKKDRPIAKMDASTAALAPRLASGVYYLMPLKDSGIAKMDAWMVEITMLFPTG